jgi:hypothetical protein
MANNYDQTKPATTAFAESEVALRERYGNAKLSPAEYQRPLRPCDLSCEGMCCYGGVSVDEGTANVLQNLSKERAADFRAMGLELPDKVVAPSEWHGVVGNITALKARPFRSLVPDFPPHFEETACVFLMDDARCGLEVLAQADGKHPWYYKPFSCWLLPIKLYDDEIRLFDEETDPFLFSDYDGFICRTQCGRTNEHGRAAAKVLDVELGFLGCLLGRDLVAEAVGTPKSREENDK